ncbi:hypothetical protein [Flavobacterium orientale]|uniref:Lipoprotein n=1 Tax=Flavobacterium orientale TaxID=1756020 RepID=A0A916XY09_9FLAO|nr:hypothetical protein [Flavobacterium orientale]GGD21254.1 hypothetical protein GCM10011343_09640 [Flavobacterium orientale]
MKTHSLIVLISLLIISCNKKDNNKTKELTDFLYTSDLQIEKIEKDSLLKRAINNGDSIAYKKISRNFLSSNRASEFYIYSFMMANEHNSAKAFYDLYDIMMFSSDYINQFNRKKSKEMSIYYLLKSYELNYKAAERDIKDYFDVNNVPSSKVYFDSIQNR